MTWTVSLDGRKAAANALLALANGGTIAFFTGTRPYGPDNTETGTFLVQMDLNAVAFDPAGVGGFAAINVDVAVTGIAEDTGTAGWGRIITSGFDGLLDGTVGVELLLDNVNVIEGAVVELTGGGIYMYDGNDD